MKKTMILKWDFEYWPFEQLDKEKTKDGVSFFYGNCSDNINKLKNNSSSYLDENTDVFIYYTNIPGASEQILFKLSNITVKDINGFYLYDKVSEDNSKYRKYAIAKKIEVIMDENDVLKFTREGLITNGWDLEQRINVKILDEKNKNLVDELNKYRHKYNDYKDILKHKCECYFKDKELPGITKSSHDLFSTKRNLPYNEQHHFILQEVYRTYINETNKKELKSIIYSTNNIILLCPRCHRMIHHGNEEIVKKMINILKNDPCNSKLFNDIKKIENIINKTDLISEMYNIKF